MGTLNPLPPFQALLDRHSGDVLGFLIAAVGPTDAEDCFQETMISALRGYPRLEDDRNLRGWLLTIAHRKAIDHHRARGRRARPSGDAVETEQLDRRRGERTTGDPQAALDGRTDLWGAVATLPPKQRSAVALRFACDLRHGEIGAALGITEEAARRNVHEGVKRLREVIA
jgi:RNA polymerase sigma factor (sigma-70 family)